MLSLTWNWGRSGMEQTGNWRTTAIGLGLTILVVGTGLAFAFW